MDASNRLLCIRDIVGGENIKLPGVGSKVDHYRVTVEATAVR